MISLTTADLPSDLDYILRFSGDLPAGINAVARSCGIGQWNAFLPKDADTYYAFLRTDGTMHVEGRKTIDTRPILGVDTNSLQTSTINLTADFLRPWRRFGTTPPHCVLLRRRSAIAMVRVLGNDINRLMTPPQMSAHERIADAAALEQEFPGMFEFKG